MPDGRPTNLNSDIIDENNPARPRVIIDTRLDQRSPLIISEELSKTDYQGRGLWNLFSRVKYFAAAKGPREPGRRVEDLQRAAALMRDALEMTWRAGYRGEDVADCMLAMLKRVKESPVPVSVPVQDGICPRCGGAIQD